MEVPAEDGTLQEARIDAGTTTSLWPDQPDAPAEVTPGEMQDAGHPEAEHEAAEGENRAAPGVSQPEASQQPGPSTVPPHVAPQENITVEFEDDSADEADAAAAAQPAAPAHPDQAGSHAQQGAEAAAAVEVLGGENEAANGEAAAPSAGHEPAQEAGGRPARGRGRGRGRGGRQARGGNRAGRGRGGGAPAPAKRETMNQRKRKASEREQPDTDEEHEEEPAAEEQGTLQSQRRSLRPRKSLKVDTDFATEEAAGADGDAEPPGQPNGPGGGEQATPESGGVSLSIELAEKDVKGRWTTGGPAGAKPGSDGGDNAAGAEPGSSSDSDEKPLAASGKPAGAKADRSQPAHAQPKQAQQQQPGAGKKRRRLEKRAGEAAAEPAKAVVKAEGQLHSAEAAVAPPAVAAAPAVKGEQGAQPPHQQRAHAPAKRPRENGHVEAAAGDNTEGGLRKKLQQQHDGRVPGRAQQGQQAAAEAPLSTDPATKQVQLVARRLRRAQEAFEEAGRKRAEVALQVEGLLANIRSTPMTIPILRSSGIGKDITRLMKWNPPPDPAFARVAAAAKALQGEWKALSGVAPQQPKQQRQASVDAVAPKQATAPSRPGKPAGDARLAEAKAAVAKALRPGAPAANGGPPHAGPSTGAPAAKQGAHAAAAAAAQWDSRSASAEKEVTATAQNAGPGTTGNAVRDKAVAILAHALRPRGQMAPDAAARQLEAALHEHYAQGTPLQNGDVAHADAADPGIRYKRRLRVLWEWLLPEGQAHCPELRRRYLHCKVAAADLATMGPERVAAIHQQAQQREQQLAQPAAMQLEPPATQMLEAPNAAQGPATAQAPPAQSEGAAEAADAQAVAQHPDGQQQQQQGVSRPDPVAAEAGTEPMRMDTASHAAASTKPLHGELSLDAWEAPAAAAGAVQANPAQGTAATDLACQPALQPPSAASPFLAGAQQPPASPARTPDQATTAGPPGNDKGASPRPGECKSDPMRRQCNGEHFAGGAAQAAAQQQLCPIAGILFEADKEQAPKGAAKGAAAEAVHAAYGVQLGAAEQAAVVSGEADMELE